MAQLPRNKKLSERRPLVSPEGIVKEPPQMSNPPQIFHGQQGPKDKDKDKNKGGKNDNKGDGKGDGKKGPGYKTKGRFGAYGGYKGVSRKKVNRLVGGVIRDEVRDLNHERRSVRREYKRNKRDVNRSFRRGQQDLKHVFGETGDFINSLGATSQQSILDQSAQINAAQAALQQQLGGTYTGAQQAGAEELARLGISGGGNFGQLIADQANAQAMGAQNAANQQATLGAMGGNAQQLMGMLAGMNQGSFMSNAGLNLQRRNDALIEARGNRDENMQTIRDAIRDTKLGRRDLFFQMLNQLQETGWSQYMDQQQLNMAKRDQRHRLKND